MDNLIESIIDYMKMDVEALKAEYESNYTNLRECPSYPAVKAYCDAIKALNRLDGRYTAYTTPRGCLNRIGVGI